MEPVGDAVGGGGDVVVGDVEGECRQGGFGDEALEEFLFADEAGEVVVLVGLAGDGEAFVACGGEGVGGAGAEDEAEVEGAEAVFEPAEIIMDAAGHELDHAGGEMEAVDDPGVVALEFEEAGPGGEGFHGEGFFVGFEIDEAAAPGEVGEGAPFAGDEGGGVAVAAGADDAGVLVEREGEVGLESEAGAFEDDFGRELVSHMRSPS